MPLIADLSQSIALLRCQCEIDLDADEVHDEGEPEGHAEAEAEGCADFGDFGGGEGGVNGDVGVGAGGVVGTLGVAGGYIGGVVVVHEEDFIAGARRIVGSGLGDDEGGDDHDQAKGDDSAEVEHGAQHPGAVLVDLEALDVVVGEAEAGGAENDEDADSGLGVEGAAEGASADHQGADVGD